MQPFLSFSFLLSGKSFSILFGELLIVLNFLFAGVYKTAELWQVKEQGPLPLMPPKKRNCSMVFTLKEMEEATGKFSDKNLVGKGGFGRVYRGVLKNGQVHFQQIHPLVFRRLCCFRHLAFL